CTSYRAAAGTIDRRCCEIDPHVADRVVGLRLVGDAPHGSTQGLTALLSGARPEYDPRPPADAASFVGRIGSESGLPVLFRSFGPTPDDIASTKDVS
ncbi:MAG: hypothetical protein M3R22_01190, partial [Pseudomonadota bacterium]|nr:hypothetical protein [Pseudomonadota bacterium]